MSLGFLRDSGTLALAVVGLVVTPSTPLLAATSLDSTTSLVSGGVAA